MNNGGPPGDLMSLWPEPRQGVLSRLNTKA